MLKVITLGSLLNSTALPVSQGRRKTETGKSIEDKVSKLNNIEEKVNRGDKVK